MNILFVGNTEGTSTSIYYFNGLVRLGHTVFPFNPKYLDFPSLKDRVAFKLRGTPSPKRVQRIDERLVSLCKQNQFDVIFVMSENFLSHQTIEAIRNLRSYPPLVLYHSHDNNFSEGIIKPKEFTKNLATYDYVFTTKSQNVEKYKRLGQMNSKFIPSAFEPSVHRPISDRESQFRNQWFEVTFVGTYDKSRDTYVDSAGWDRLRVWGTGWERFPSYQKHARQIQAQPIYYLEFADVLSHSKCTLGLLREEAEDRHTQRTFEIPACGAFQITQRNEEILSFFEEEKEIVCFESPEEMKDKLNFYLKNETKRKEIAKRGRERCLKDRHSYLDRTETILETIRPLL